MAKSDVNRFYLVARPRKYRHDLSPWDVGSMTKIIPNIQRVRPTVQFDIVETVYADETARNDAEVELRRLDGVRSVTATSFGSPRASNISELMLARMLGREKDAFEWPKRGTHAPFYFVWPTDTPGFAERPSCCSLRCEDLPHTESDELKRSRSYAIKFGQEIRYADFPYLDAPEKPSGKGTKKRKRSPEVAKRCIKDYGVIVAQRQENTDQIWVVLGGLSGPGTHGAADILLAGFPVSLTDYASGTVVFGIVEVETEILEVPTGDVRRRSVRAELIYGPATWQRP